MPIDNNELGKLYNIGIEYSQYYKYIEELFTVIAKVIDDKLNYHIKLLETYVINDLSRGTIIINYHKYNLSIYKYWYKSHLYLFNNIPEINYIYYRFGHKIDGNENISVHDAYRPIDAFNNISKRMDNVFNILVDIYSNNNLPKPIEEQYISADENNNVNDDENNTDSESTEDYSDNDDDKTVYNKASRNASVRLNKTIKLGSK